MNENNNNNDIKPYKATGNLNTIIGNPSININDAMHINIQSLATNQPSTNIEQNNNNQIQPNNTQISEKNTEQNVVNNTKIPEKNIQKPVVDNKPKPVSNTQISVNNTQVNTNDKINSVANTNTNQNSQSNRSVKKTYVSTIDNKPKKKNITLNLGPEFKIALLIIVILLVFIFLLPMISDFIGGY